MWPLIWYAVSRNVEGERMGGRKKGGERGRRYITLTAGVDTSFMY